MLWFQGNTIYIPYTASLCIFFSCLSIMKSMLDYNVSKVHVPDAFSWLSMFKSMSIFLDYLPFLMSAAMFKVFSLMGIFAYFQVLGFIPVVLMFISSIIVNQIALKGFRKIIPNWLLVFISIFVPACFHIQGPEEIGKTLEDVASVQSRTLFWQTLASCAIYGSSVMLLTSKLKL